MITRTRDVVLANKLVGRDFPGTDFSEVFAEPLHVCLVKGESGAIFMWRGPGIYEVHVFFAARGREAVVLGHEMLATMREQMNARMFWALVPVESRKVKMFTRLMGWKSHGLVKTRHGMNELFASESKICLQQS